jgi:hypothetical protein
MIIEKSGCEVCLLTPATIGVYRLSFTVADTSMIERVISLPGGLISKFLIKHEKTCFVLQ